MPGYSGTLFPATNLFTSVSDLARYTTALDENALLPPEYYKLMTSPFTLNSDRPSPYGLGWSVQKVGSLTAHWHYGWGDSYSALIIRLPEKKTTFILLVNSSGASAPFMLQYGNLLTSPFGVSFLEPFIPAQQRRQDQLNFRPSWTRIQSPPGSYSLTGSLHKR